MTTRARTGGRSARVLQTLISGARQAIAEDCFAEVAIAPLARSAGVSYTTVARRWIELQMPIAELRVERLLAEIGDLDLVDANRVAGWATRFSDALLKAPLHLPMCFVVALDEGIRRALTSNAENFDHGIPTVDVFMDRLVAPIAFRRLARRRDNDAEMIEATVSAIF